MVGSAAARTRVAGTCAFLLFLLAAAACVTAGTPAVIDRGMLGVWGVDARGGYEFLADGTFIMEGSTKYGFDAAGGIWHYWMAGSTLSRVTAEYKLSGDGKTLYLNLKKGHPLIKLIRVK